MRFWDIKFFFNQLGFIEDALYNSSQLFSLTEENTIISNW